MRPPRGPFRVKATAVLAKPIGGVSLLAVLLVGGCAMHPRPITLGDPASSASGDIALIHAGATRRDTLFERTNWATVTKIDDVDVKDRSGLHVPIILAPGTHAVTIRYDKDSFLCGYFGCIPFKQSEKSLTLSLEPGHSYLPQTKKLCGQDWIWIEDLGERARDDLAFWEKHRFYPPAQPVNRVAAGVAPPAVCQKPTPEPAAQ